MALRFTGDVWAVPEGTAVFAGEPLVEVTVPIAEAQLAETVLLNRVTFQAGVATKAARCALAVGGAQLVDFSFRRAQGVEAGLAVAHASAIAGFAATSNTEAARRYGLTAAGTMAHAWPGGRQAGLRGPGRAGGAGPQPAGGRWPSGRHGMGAKPGPGDLFAGHLDLAEHLDHQAACPAQRARVLHPQFVRPGRSGLVLVDEVAQLAGQRGGY